MDLTPEAVNRFIADRYPAMVDSGVICEQVEDGAAVVRWRHDPATLRPGGLISGPVQFAVADCSLWVLSFTVVGLEPMAVTSGLHITFLRPATGGDLLGRARLLRAGHSRIVGDVTLWVEGSEDRPVSHAIGTYSRLQLR